MSCYFGNRRPPRQAIGNPDFSSLDHLRYRYTHSMLSAFGNLFPPVSKELLS
jgi:hypothetical protein